MNQHHETQHAWIITTTGAVAAGAVATLLALTLSTASAMPGRGEPPVAPAPVTHHADHYVEHGCFITPHTWSDAIAGPLPRCYTYVP